MDFGQALEALKQGHKVKRAHWGGYWFIAEGAYCGEVVNEEIGLCAQHTMNPMIVACLKDNGGYAPAAPYQGDLLAEDWAIVE
ncbi:MW1434 family type I TA system toxin [Brevibacillus centrosporus]|uniref:Thoeris anti-defense Tad2 family protein n=1 Tax=Brevibacillus centrosporus TaxID=54910 RepID=UPI002E22F18D|nr:DUF2829 domain-containing protein [Brevibacillus centrosporus]